MNDKKPKLGTPEKYKKAFNKQAYKLCLLGATDAELANFFEVTETTINNWKIKHPSFFESIKKGKLKADAEIAEALFKVAKGYSHKDTKFATHEGSITDSKEYTKHYPPNVTAIKFWLGNRQRKKFQNAPEPNEQNNDDITVKRASFEDE